MSVTDLTFVQRRAVAFAVAVTQRYWTPGNDHDDRAQDAAEAVLRAKVDPTRTEQEQSRMLCIRARGGVIDGLRTEWRRGDFKSRKTDKLFRADESALESLVAAGNPEHSLMNKRAAEAVARLREPLPLIALRMIEGYSQIEIAAELGVSGSRVCQLLREIRKVVEDRI